MTTKFIKLTESMTGGDKKVLLLNTAYISHVQAGSNGKDTHIKMCHQNIDGRNHYYFVQESAEQIWAMINTDNTKSPVIMTAEEALKYHEVSGAK